MVHYSVAGCADESFSIDSAVTNNQVIYLDFDGAETRYRNRDLGMDVAVTVADSEYNERQQQYILDQLEQLYAGSGITFTINKPMDGLAYSTVYIGRTNDLASYGSFAGLAETIDEGNRIKNDNAFVFADHSFDLDETISVINHEIGHIVGGNRHSDKNDDIYEYAQGVLVGSDEKKYNVTVRRSGGWEYSLPSAYAESKSFTIDLLNGATYAEVTFSHGGKVSTSGTISSYNSNLYVSYNGSKYTISEGTRKTITITSRTSFTVTRDSTLKPHPISHRDHKIWVGGVIGYKIIGYEYLYDSTSVTHALNVSVKYYSDSQNSPSTIPSPTPTPTPTPVNYDLKPYDVSTWSSPLVVSNVSGGTTGYSSFTTDDSIYVKFAIEEDYNYAVSGFYWSLYVDGNLFSRYNVSIGERKYYSSPNIDLGKLSAGSHTIQAVIDPTNVFNETIETNNTISKTITVKKLLRNLAVTSWSMNSNYSSSEDIVMYFNVVNSGSDDAGSSYVYLYDGDTRINSVAVAALAAGGSRQCAMTIKAGTLAHGTHNLRLVADATDLIAETNENNTVSKTVTIAPPPNLAVSSVVMPGSAFVGDKIKINFKAVNAGNGSAASTYVYVYNGNTKITGVAVPSLASGASYQTGVSFNASLLGVGSHNIRLVIDPNNQIKESNENNTVTRTLKVSEMSNLTVTDLVMPSSIRPSEKLVVKFNIRNVGKGLAGASYAYVYAGNTKLTGVAVPQLQPGGVFSTGVSIPAGKLAVGGVYDIRVVADATGKITESNENNTAYGTVKVQSYPNLAITGWTMNKQYYIDQKITLSFTVVNTGKGPAAASTAYLYDGNRRLTTLSVPWLNAKASYKAALSIKPGVLGAGTHNLRLVADGGNVIEESNENNTVSKSVIINERANLAVSNLYMPSIVSTLDDVKISFNVVNSGKGLAGSTYLYIYDGSRKITGVAIPQLAAGAVYKTGVTIDSALLGRGTHKLRLVADATDKVPESNENNTSYGTVTVKNPPNLAVSAVSLPGSAKAGTDVKLVFNVVNGGEVAAQSSYVYLYDGNRKISGVAIPQLAAGGVYKTGITVKAGTLAAGTHNLRLVADATGKVAESNENNTLKHTLEIVSRAADLNISAVSAVSSATTADNVKITFKVSNSGDNVARASYVYVYDGNTKLTGVAIPQLAAGATYSTGVTIKAGTLSAGTHNIRLVADATSLIKEYNENNTVSKTLTVTRVLPNLAITGVDMASEVSSAGDYKIKFNVVNGGKTLAGASYVYVYDGNTRLTGVAIPQLAAGATYSTGVTIKAGTLAAGTHNLRLVADATGKVAESNENNTVSSPVMVYDYDICTYCPDSWADGVVLSNEVEYYQNTILYEKQNVYLNLAIQEFYNNSIGEFAFAIMVDGELESAWRVHEINSGRYVSQRNYNLGSFSAGRHNVTIVLDVYDDYAEVNEANNIISKDFYVYGTNGAANNQGMLPDDFDSGVTGLIGGDDVPASGWEDLCIDLQFGSDEFVDIADADCFAGVTDCDELDTVQMPCGNSAAGFAGFAAVSQLKFDEFEKDDIVKGILS